MLCWILKIVSLLQKKTVEFKLVTSAISVQHSHHATQSWTNIIANKFTVVNKFLIKTNTLG